MLAPEMGQQTDGAGQEAMLSLLVNKFTISLGHCFSKSLEVTMTTYEILELAAIVTSFAVVRLGIPVLLMWALGQMLHRLQHS